MSVAAAQLTVGTCGLGLKSDRLICSVRVDKALVKRRDSLPVHGSVLKEFDQSVRRASNRCLGFETGLFRCILKRACLMPAHSLRCLKIIIFLA